ncbi:MAG: hypothetical protein D6798_04340 [Deltaproteobacteria bacterium]|nr:MAG: hypothetical protein D6798_04340 [Deltaproteobacteria bacterium]
MNGPNEGDGTHRVNDLQENATGRARLAGGMAVLVVLVATLWPLRAALSTGAVPGAGPDVVSTLWGNWWFTRVGVVGAFGGWTDLVNYPAGAVGALLSPSTALCWALARPLLGDGGAMSAAVVLQVLGLAGGAGLLCRRIGGSWAAVTVAALVVVAARFLPYGAGEGSVVAIAALPLPLGLWALVGRVREQASTRGIGLGEAVLLAACMPALALENPYLAPILPAAVGIAWARSWRPGGSRRVRLQLGMALLVGGIGVLLVSELFGAAAASDYPVERAGEAVRLLGMDLPVVDMPWARAAPRDLFWPGPIEWTIDVNSARDNPGGGRYLGLAALLLAVTGVLARPRQSAPWAVLGLSGILLGLGSMVGRVGGPFLYLNAVLFMVARPLTQPTRFLVVGLIGLAICAGLAVDAIKQRYGRRAALVPLAAVLIDGFVAGGPSLRLPVLELPRLSCAADLPDGAVLTWPTDALGGWPAAAQLLQMAHGHPAAHRGIASWRLKEPHASETLRRLGYDRHTASGIDAAGLVAVGYRAVLVEEETPADEREWLRDTLGEPVASCDGIVVHDLGLATGRRSPAPRAGFDPARAAGRLEAEPTAGGTGR